MVKRLSVALMSIGLMVIKQSTGLPGPDVVVYKYKGCSSFYNIFKIIPIKSHLTNLFFSFVKKEPGLHAKANACLLFFKSIKEYSSVKSLTEVWFLVRIVNKSVKFHKKCLNCEESMAKDKSFWLQFSKVC